MKRNQITLTIAVLFFCSIPIFGIRPERVIDSWRPLHYNISITLNDSLSEITTARADIEVVAVKKLSLVDLDFADLSGPLVDLITRLPGLRKLLSAIEQLTGVPYEGD